MTQPRVTPRCASDDMKAPGRGLQHPQVALPRTVSSSSSSLTSSSTSPSQDPFRPQQLCSDVLERWTDNVIHVDDASRVLECSQVDRQGAFQRLVRHYICQILYGCDKADCRARTCLSSVSHHATRPVRPPTQLTARALAYYLATQNDPHKELCPNTLKVPPSSLEIEGAAGVASIRCQDGGQHYSVYPAAWRLSQQVDLSYGDVATAVDANMHGSRGKERGNESQGVVDTVNKRHQIKKDSKSISQNLFDSVAMIYSYSKHIPSTSSVFEALQSFSTSNRSPAVKTREDGSAQASFQSNLRDEHKVGIANDAIVTHSHINGALAVQSRNNHLEQSHPPPTNAEVARNGQQIHRIPYHPERMILSRKSSRRASQSSETTIESPKLSIMKTGKKNFTLGGITTFQKPKNEPLAETPKVTITATPTISAEKTIPIMTRLNTAILEEFKDEDHQHRKDQSPDMFNYNVDFDVDRPLRPSKALVNRSLFYTLSDAETLLESFRENNPAFEASPLPHLNSSLLVQSFGDWHRRNGALIFDSLWIAVGALFVPPPAIGRSTKGTGVPASTQQPRYLSNTEAAHVIMICIHALTSHIEIGWPHTWAQLRKLRSWGVIIPSAAPKTDGYEHPYMSIIDGFEFEPAVRLADRLLRGIGARRCFEHILGFEKQRSTHQNLPGSRKPEPTIFDILLRHLSVVERVALSKKQNMAGKSGPSDDPGWTVTATLVEWLKTIILKGWDSEAIINKWSSVGTAVTLLDAIHQYHLSHSNMNLFAHMFEMPFLNERLDAVDEPVNFMKWKWQPNHFHILQYPALFPDDYLVRYFRTINFHVMIKHYNHTTRTNQFSRTLDMFLRDSHRWLIGTRMKVTFSEYLFLDISRQNPLEDTLDQLWKLEKRMLCKPLKVKMGKDEGEVGLDHGGVTYEFFRVVLSEAFNPHYGMFTINAQTRMTWFQQESLEPEWKFEMIGIIFSLAIYNGITLPVTFPLALYRFLIPHEAPLHDRQPAVGTDCMKDGWPDLASSFEQLLNWSDGDVGEAIMRDYAFSYEAFGKRVDQNMEENYIRPKRTATKNHGDGSKTTTISPPSEPKLVTNENRRQFVVDYIKHLTYFSIEPQITAFKRGFQTCIDPKSLHLFSPSTLRNLVEGSQYISIPDLRRITRYEQGYTTTHSTILDFWSIVTQFNQDDARHLLEFVTASDRVPVTGYEGIVFHIVRSVDAEALPTSSTCFGTLYLPEYKDREQMKAKLELAIRNSKGFGVF